MQLAESLQYLPNVFRQHAIAEGVYDYLKRYEDVQCEPASFYNDVVSWGEHEYKLTDLHYRTPDIYDYPYPPKEEVWIEFNHMAECWVLAKTTPDNYTPIWIHRDAALPSN